MQNAKKILEPGDVVANRYELTGRISSGGMGTVFEALDRHLDKPVAVKVLAPKLVGEPEAAKRFQREAQIAARMRHDSICDVTDYGITDSGIPFLVMELLRGESLEDILQREGKLEPALAAEIAGQLLDALVPLHSAGIVHRDLKPGNIIVLHGETERVRIKLIDFGIAKLLGAELAMTSQGRILGTSRYMSPEQANGDVACLDGRSDLWSVGVILYRAVTGAAPFKGSLYNTLEQIMFEDPTPPVELEPATPDILSEAILMAMSKRPEARFQSAQAFAGVLRRMDWLKLDRARSTEDAHPTTAGDTFETTDHERWCHDGPLTDGGIALSFADTVMRLDDAVEVLETTRN